MRQREAEYDIAFASGGVCLQHLRGSPTPQVPGPRGCRVPAAAALPGAPHRGSPWVHSPGLRPARPPSLLLPVRSRPEQTPADQTVPCPRRVAKDVWGCPIPRPPRVAAERGSHPQEEPRGCCGAGRVPSSPTRSPLPLHLRFGPGVMGAPCPQRAHGTAAAARGDTRGSWLRPLPMGAGLCPGCHPQSQHVLGSPHPVLAGWLPSSQTPFPRRCFLCSTLGQSVWVFFAFISFFFFSKMHFN